MSFKKFRSNFYLFFKTFFKNFDPKAPQSLLFYLIILASILIGCSVPTLKQGVFLGSGVLILTWSVLATLQRWK